MAGPTNTPGGSGKTEIVDFDDFLYIHPSDNNVTTIVTIKLTGNENFLLWHSSMIRGLRAINKLGFVDGSLKKSIADESKTLKWEHADVVVCSWGSWVYL